MLLKDYSKTNTQDDSQYYALENIFCYRKIPKISDTRKIAVITLNVGHDGFSLE